VFLHFIDSELPLADRGLESIDLFGVDLELRDFLAEYLLEEVALAVQLILPLGKEVLLLLLGCIAKHLDEGHLFNSFLVPILLGDHITMAEGQRSDLLVFFDSLRVQLLEDEKLALVLEL
jgi:hypothetical protein